MIKLRQAGYCNLKLLLLYLVVYGHWLETSIGNSKIVLVQYRIIYYIHMPLFAFLSGLFLRSKGDCARQIKPWLDRTFSSSRTIVFFPYFWAGLICKQDTPWQKFCFHGLVSLGAAVMVLLLIGKDIPATFLYHAEPYKASMRALDMVKLAEASDVREHIHILLQNGFLLRLLCYALSGLLGFFILTVVPDKRFPCTRAGADTMFGYLIHAPIVAVLRELNLSWGICAVLSAVLLYVIYKILQWNSPLYGVKVRKTAQKP